MSTGMLRRHYRQAAEANPSAAARPVVEQPKGIEAELRAEVARLTAANAAIVEQAARWKTEAVALGWENSTPDDITTAQAVELAQRKLDQAKADVDNWQATLDQRLAALDAEMSQPENVDTGVKPEPPARSAKTADWVAFATDNPLDPPLDLDPRPGLRDEIAGAYLGEG